MNETDQKILNGDFKAALEAAMAELPPEAPKLVVDKVPQPNPQLIEPKKEDVVLCTYPATLDGRLAAWVVRRIARTHNIPVEFTTEDTASAMPGQNHIRLSDGVFPVGTEGKSLLVLLSGHTRPGSSVFPAPLPFAQWKRTFPFGVETMTKHEGKAPAVVGDPAKSLSAIAWDFFYADRVGFDKRPRAIDYVNDDVTNKNAFNDTAAVVACLSTYPGDFQTLDKLVEACDDRKRLAFIVTSGQAVLRYIAQNAEVED